MVLVLTLLNQTVSTVTAPQYNRQHLQLKSIFVTQDKALYPANDKELILMAVTEGQLISDGTAVWKVKKIGSEVPAGTMQMFAGNTIPAGWLLCDGSAVSRTNYAKLFSAIGTTWGAGDGSTTFNLPNSIGRFAEGAATSGSYHEAGLPNIEGSISSFNNYWFAVANRQVGALYTNNATTTDASRYANMTGTVMDNNRGASMVNFDASKSNSIYGASATVQPPALTMLPIIKY